MLSFSCSQTINLASCTAVSKFYKQQVKKMNWIVFSRKKRIKLLEKFPKESSESFRSRVYRPVIADPSIIVVLTFGTKNFMLVRTSGILMSKIQEMLLSEQESKDKEFCILIDQNDG